MCHALLLITALYKTNYDVKTEQNKNLFTQDLKSCHALLLTNYSILDEI